MPDQPRPTSRPRLVLAGLGHSHLFVLEAIRLGQLPPCELVVCTGEPRHAYSGMVPGWLSGQYHFDELSLDVAELVRGVGGRLRAAHVTGLDPKARVVTLADGSTEEYDVCSIAVGSQVSGTEIPGVREFALALKPLGVVRKIGERLDALVAAGGGEVVVVGGGMAGVELALALRARADQGGARAASLRVSLVSRDASLVQDRHPRFTRALRQICEQQEVRLRLSTGVQRVDARQITLVRGDAAEVVPADLVVWATGGVAPPWLAQSGLATDARGFLLVDDRLRSISDERVCAAGDSATMASAPNTPKAGVYAVRMGPRLARSLAHALGDPTRPGPYRPQRRFLALATLSDGTALASWGGLVARGRWALRWKDWIDRRFMRRFAPKGG